MKTIFINRKYYKKRLWKITQKLVGTHARPYCVKGGFRFVKIYEKREKIGVPFNFVRGKAVDC